MKPLIVFYSFVFILFILFSYLFIDPNFRYLEAFFSGIYYEQRLLVSLVYAFLISAMFGCYFLLLKNEKVITLSPFLLSIPLIGIFAYPAVVSYDLFNYIATAKVSFYYLENPYIIMPIEFLGDPVLQFTRAANKIALYGPFWIVLTALPFLLSLGSYLVSIVLFKSFISLFYFGSLILIWKITRNKSSVIFLAASPLVIVETFISGHNDIVMMFFVLLAVYFLKNKMILLSLLFLIASIFIKYSTVFLLPVFAYYIYLVLKDKKINWDKFYFASFISLTIIFLLSPIREELYPWYAIWLLTFIALLNKKTKLIFFSFFFSLGLMLSYLPYMYYGTYSGVTPILKTIIIVLFAFLGLIYIKFQRKFS